MRTSDLKMAVFIDFDNIEIGVKTTLGSRFDVGAVLEALKERGEVVSKTAYGDWKRSEGYSRSLTQHAIKMVQRNVTPGGDKNGADINLVVDALEMAFRHDHLNAFVIVGGDSDFIALVEKLQQYDKKVFVVGGRAFTSTVLQRNCHEFIAYENLIPTHQAPRRREPSARAAGQSPVAQAVPLVRRAMLVLAERDVTPQLGLLKSTLLQLDSTFSERNYGASTFRQFAEKLVAEGLVALTGSGRTIRVELKDTVRSPAEPEIADTARTPAESELKDEGEAPTTVEPTDAASAPARTERKRRSRRPRRAGPRDTSRAPATAENDTGLAPTEAAETEAEPKDAGQPLATVEPTDAGHGPAEAGQKDTGRAPTEAMPETTAEPKDAAQAATTAEQPEAPVATKTRKARRSRPRATKKTPGGDGDAAPTAKRAPRGSGRRRAATPST